MAATSNGRVLVVAPDPAVQTSELHRHGFEVLNASQSSALDLAEAGVFDVVLLDVGMPDVDDFSFVLRLRDHAPSTRVVLLMAKHTNELAAQASEAGVFQMLQKPADGTSLLRVVRAGILARRDALAQGAPGARASQSPSVGFDELAARMRTPEARGAARRLFTASPFELGEDALLGATPKGD